MPTLAVDPDLVLPLVVVAPHIGHAGSLLIGSGGRTGRRAAFYP